MVISTAPVIHPDTLNYHAFSTQIFNQFGVIPGIANLKPELGFQSMWFAASGFFSFSVSDDILIFPLNGCVADLDPHSAGFRDISWQCIFRQVEYDRVGEFGI